MFTKFNKIEDFKGMIEDKIIMNQEIYSLVRNAALLIHEKFGVKCGSDFLNDLTYCIDEIFDVDWIDGCDEKLIQEDLSSSITRANSISEIYFDLFGMGETTFFINEKIKFDLYGFTPSLLANSTHILNEFAGNVGDLNFNNGFIFYCLRSFIHEFEQRFSVVVPHDFIRDFNNIFVYHRDTVWPDNLLNFLRDELENSTTIKDLSFSIPDSSHVELLKNVNFKLQHYFYDFNFLDVYYCVQVDFDKLRGADLLSANRPAVVKEVRPYKGTKDISNSYIIYKGGWNECEALVEDLNSGKTTHNQVLHSSALNIDRS